MHELKKAIYLYILPRTLIAFVVVFLFILLTGLHYNPALAIALIAAISAVSFMMISIYEKHVMEEYTSGTPFFARLKLPDGRIGSLQNSIKKVEPLDEKISEEDLDPEIREALKRLGGIPEATGQKIYYVEFLEPVEVGDYVVKDAVLVSPDLLADLASYPDVEFFAKGCFLTLAAAVMTWKVISIMKIGEERKRRETKKYGRLIALVVESKARNELQDLEMAAIRAVVANTLKIKKTLEEEVKQKENELKATKEALDAAEAKILRRRAQDQELINLDILVEAAKPYVLSSWVKYAILGVGAVVGGLLIGAFFSGIILHVLGR